MKCLKSYFPNATFVAVLLVIAHSLFAGILYFAPITLWVDYIDIQPAEKINILGKSVHFFTYLDVHHNVDIQYNDILRCKTGAKEEGSKTVWKWQGSQSTKHLMLEASDGPYYGPWDFEAKNIDLEYPDECVVESTINVTVWPGVVKQVKHYTDPFYMTEHEK